MKTTLSVIKADIGGYVGHSHMHPELIETANKKLSESKLIIDHRALACGDDLELIMTHQMGADNKEIHKLAWDIFLACTDVAKRLGLYGAGQDLLADTFSGNVKGMGPGVAEMEINERVSEPIVIFMADKTEPGAWNYPLYKIFADPFNTAGLVIDPKLHPGFIFEVHDVLNSRKIMLRTPEEIYDLLVYIGAPGRYCIKSVIRKDNEISSVSSTQKLNLMAGHYVGKDDPVCIVRCQSGFPSVGEVVEPFSFPYIVAGWMRGSHHGPIMPVSFSQANPTRFDGPPRVIAAGFQLKDGKLVGPVDMFDDPSFDTARKESSKIADILRRHGPFEPHRLSLDEMEYTTFPDVEKKLKDRWEPID